MNLLLGESSIVSLGSLSIWPYPFSPPYAFIQTFLFCVLHPDSTFEHPEDFAGMRIAGQWRLACGPPLSAPTQNVAPPSVQCSSRNVAPSSAIHINSLHAEGECFALKSQCGSYSSLSFTVIGNCVGCVKTLITLYCSIEGGYIVQSGVGRV